MIQRLGSRESYRRKMTNSNQAMAQSSAASQEQVPHAAFMLHHRVDDNIPERPPA